MPNSKQRTHKKVPQGKTFTRQGRACYRSNITLTFKDPIAYDEGMYRLCAAFRRTPTLIDYVIYPEYGENGNLHFHGTVWYSNKLHFCSMINNWRYFYGFAKLQAQYKTSNQVKWHLYCRKDQWQFKDQRYPRINFKNVKRAIKYFALKTLS